MSTDSPVSFRTPRNSLPRQTSSLLGVLRHPIARKTQTSIAASDSFGIRGLESKDATTAPGVEPPCERIKMRSVPLAVECPASLGISNV